MTNINESIKIIFDGKELDQNRFDIATTRDSVQLRFTVINVSKILQKDIRFTFPEGIKVQKPKRLPDRMIPKEEFELSVSIDTSITKTFGIEIQSHFLKVSAR